MNYKKKNLKKQNLTRYTNRQATATTTKKQFSNKKNYTISKYNRMKLEQLICLLNFGLRAIPEVI